MCLLAFAYQSHPRWRFLLAGNRDEFHERPSAALARWPGTPPVWAGRDLRSGGTWTGVGACGRFAVVTNVRDPSIALAQAPTRGRLPVDFLVGTDRASGHAATLLDSAPQYAPFNLLLLDAQGCQFASNYPELRTHAVPAGIHGLSNGDLDEPWPKTRRLMAALAGWTQRRDDDVEPLWQALADERLADDAALPDTGVGLERERMLSAAFIRNPVYGTRTSTLVAIDAAGDGWISERRFGPDGVFEGETTLRIGAEA